MTRIASKVCCSPQGLRTPLLYRAAAMRCIITALVRAITRPCCNVNVVAFAAELPEYVYLSSGSAAASSAGDEGCSSVGKPWDNRTRLVAQK
jgi:hypothetical protein